VIRYIFQLYPTKINIQNDEQKTPLHLAASLGDIEMCQILIECGARVNSFIQTSAVSGY
jgi:ankyrin repeat protein